MQKISSANYPPTRLILPRLAPLHRRSVQLTIAGVVLLSVFAGLWLLLLPLLLPLILLAAIHHSPNVVFQNFCQNVWIGENEFMVQLKDQTLQIPFTQVQAITWHGYNNPPRVRIVLASPIASSQIFTFVPDLTQGRSKAKVMAERLRVHVLNNA